MSNQIDGGILLEDKAIDNGETLHELVAKPNQKKNTDSWFLYISVITPSLLYLHFACILTWPSMVLPRLKSNDSTVNPLGRIVETYECSIIAASPVAGSLFGLTFFGNLNNVLGARKTLILCSVVLLISSTILAFANNIIIYYVMRTVQGVAWGTANTPYRIFILEITDKQNRGKFGTYMAVFLITGSLCGYLLGPLFSVRIFTLLAAAPTMVCFLLLISLIPESPYYLIRKGKKLSAIQVLRKLTCREDVDNNIQEIGLLLSQPVSFSNSNWKNLFKDRLNRNIISIGCILSLLFSLSGHQIMFVFAAPVLDSAGIYLSGNSVIIMACALQLALTFLATIFTEKVGRKTLLIISCIGSSFAHMLIGLLFYLKNKNISFTGYSWVVVFGVFLLIMSYSIGLSSLVHVVQAEIFPNSIKTTALSLSTIISSLGVSSVLFCFPFGVEYLGVHWCFWFFAMVCLSGPVFIYYVVPETRGKPLIEIQEIFIQRYTQKNNN